MATVCFKKDKKEQEILRDVADIKVEGVTITLSPLFGEKKCIKAKIKEIDFLNSKVLLTLIDTQETKDIAEEE